MARSEGKRKHPDTSSWAAAAVGWMSSALPPGKFTLYFHSTSFLQGKSKVTQPISIIMLIHSSLHSPARSLRTTESALLVCTDKETSRTFWTGHSNLPHCWGTAGFMGHFHPAAAFWASFTSPSSDAHGSTELSVSCKLHLRNSVLTDKSHTHNPLESAERQPWDRPMERYFGIQVKPSLKLGENWTGPWSFGCTPELMLCFSVVSALVP